MHQMNTTINWHILGSGAIGSLWATKFLERNISCCLLHRPDSAHASTNTGKRSIQLTRLDGSVKKYSTYSRSTDNSGLIKQLLVCTKSYQTIEALTSLLNQLDNNVVIVLLQNGVGQHSLVTQLLPNARVIAATTTQGALLESPFAVKHTGAGDSFFGDIAANTVTLMPTLVDIGMQHHGDISALLWQKLSINCAINPLTALYQCTNGELLSNARYYAHFKSICEEIDIISQALNFKNAQSTLERATTVASATANNYSSMLQDIKHQRKTEIAFINGYLQQQAKVLGKKLHVNDQLINDISLIEQPNT